MSASLSLLRHHTPILRSYAAMSAAQLKSTLIRRPALPAEKPAVQAVLPPRDPDLVNAFLEDIGDDPAHWRGQVPPHLYPQWSLGLLGKLLAGQPYPFTKIVNAGAAMTVHGELPLNQPLEINAQLAEVDADERRALLTIRVETSAPGKPPAVTGDMTMLVPLSKRRGGKGGSAKGAVASEPELIPDMAPAEEWMLGLVDARRFCLTTGDINPLHWLPIWAKLSGFKSPIMHGFGTFTRAAVALRRAHEGRRVEYLDARFARPLPLPSSVGFYHSDGSWWVGRGAGERAMSYGDYRVSAG